MSAHRLTLTGPEWLVLCRTAGVPLDEWIGPADPPAEQELAAARDALTARGVLDGDAEAGVHPSLAANLAIFAVPSALVRAEVSMGDRGLRAAYAVQALLGASVFTLAGGGAELSMFPAAELGEELLRCVPEIPAGAGRTISRLVPDALKLSLVGRLPLSALTDYGAVPGFVPGAAGRAALTEAEAALATELSGRTVGVLHCQVVGVKPPEPGDEATQALAGDVVWFATDTGWVGLSPHPDGSGRQLVDLVPVNPDEIGSWLAPYLARIWELSHG